MQLQSYSCSSQLCQSQFLWPIACSTFCPATLPTSKQYTGYRRLTAIELQGVPWIRNENQIYMCRACISILGITTKQLPLLFGCFIPSGPERWHAAAAVLKLKIFFPYFFKPFEK
ncbi:hypothetical protein Y1Q_0006333 [Alligator mississippiensis]|uniref:Uncharacterized protein n=1 Tax=Alligator mississippiensis TaxID=8496 RepID=A0A151NXE4_ALLMI|nr:hypothetical protein Y1Q_0006333 [Alligator mississippiensis]